MPLFACEWMSQVQTDNLSCHALCCSISIFMHPARSPYPTGESTAGTTLCNWQPSHESMIVSVRAVYHFHCETVLAHELLQRPIVCCLRHAAASPSCASHIQSQSGLLCTAAYGVVRNPYSLDRSSAGSSGGPAAGAAASYAMISFGTDTGNSIRGPSGHQGLVGLRSSIGQTSR